MKTTDQIQSDALAVHEMRGEVTLSRKTKAAIEAARAEQPESHAIDLWEDNAGGLAIVCRASGVGFCGFERGQNVARLRAAGRDEFTFASDATPDNFAELGEGNLYSAMPDDEVEALYEREGEANADVRVRILWGVAAGSAVELRPDVPITITEARALVGPAAAARVVALPALRAHKLRAVPVA